MCFRYILLLLTIVQFVALTSVDESEKSLENISSDTKEAEIDSAKQEIYGSVLNGQVLNGQIIGIGEVIASNLDNIAPNFRPDDSTRREVNPDKIHFVSYNSNGQEGGRSKITSNTPPEGCRPSDPLAIIVHGWRGDCQTDWVRALARNLGTYRGGCITCLDYAAYSKDPSYSNLARKFEGITRYFVKKLASLISNGFRPERTFMFGFSFGSRVCIEAGKRMGDQIYEAMDLCDPAGPGFDIGTNLLNCDYRKSAKNVQVIHTSRQYGTKCTTGGHQNWRMGNCGITQPAALNNPIRSHGLCPYFYNSAFHHAFCSVPNLVCVARNRANPPKNFCMGYMERRKQQVRGELFALTTEKAPWNIPTLFSYATWLKAPVDSHGKMEFSDLNSMVTDWERQNITFDYLILQENEK